MAIRGLSCHAGYGIALAFGWLVAASVGAADGQFAVSYVREIRGAGETAINQPIGVAVRAGLVYVAQQDDHVQVYTEGGAFVCRFGARGNGSGQFFLVSGITTDLASNVFVVDLGYGGDSRVQKFSACGSFLAAWSGAGLDRFNWLRDVAVDASGSVYAADWGKRRVMQFAGDGAMIGELGASEFYPWGLAVDDARGRLYVARQNGGSVLVLSLARLEILTSWSQLPNLKKMAVDREGRLYGIGANTVYVLSPTGERLGQWGSPGNGPGEFRDATGIAVDDAGLVYVADYASARIQVFSVRFE